MNAEEVEAWLARLTETMNRFTIALGAFTATIRPDSQSIRDGRLRELSSVTNALHEMLKNRPDLTRKSGKPGDPP